MADRSIRVILRAEVADFKRAMGEAAKATEQVTPPAQRAQTALGRMVESADQNRAAWTTAGTTLLAAGGAITAIGVAALKAGIAYNTLQQTSRAALTTLLGSAEAANRQMDKLDDFARNSPFAKQVFITAQRQMIGFGIASEKVIPYLDAIQNGVAAMGGSNEDISELSRIISQISASAKITATDLREFGNRGVDAATIIGSQMGKTGAQIREDITDGALDAQVALDALAAGMQERFGGAAENVKNTFEGSIDRVKAAWRDLASELATPLVDPNGGGLLIDWANSIADVMRGVQGLPEPIKVATVAVAGLAAGAMLLSGAFLVGLPRYIETKKAFAELAAIHPKVAAGATKVSGAMKSIGAAALAVTATAVATGMLVEKLKGGVAVPNANALARALREAGDSADGIGDLAGQFDGFGDVLGMSVNSADGLTDAFDQLLRPDVTDRIAGFVGSLGPWNSYMENLEGRAKGLDVALSGMVSAGDVDQVRAFQKSLEAAGYSAEEINRLLPQTEDALIGAEDAAGGAAVNATALAAATEEAAAAAEVAKKAHDDWVASVVAADATFVNLQDVYSGVITKNQEMAQATADATESSTDSWQDYYDGVTVSAQDYIAGLQAQVDAQVAWQDNLIAISERVNTTMSGDMREAANAMIEELMRLGPEGAAQVELMKGMTDAELAQVVTLYGIRGGEAGGRYGGELAAKIEATHPKPIGIHVDASSAYANLDALQRRLSAVANTRVVIPFSTETHAAAGGYITGPGTGTSDSIPARLSNGEYVVKAAAVQRYGVHTFDQLNAMRFASGGYVGTPPAPTSPAPAFPTDGWSISGRLEVGGDGIARLVDGRLSNALSDVRRQARMKAGV